MTDRENGSQLVLLPNKAEQNRTMRLQILLFFHIHEEKELGLTIFTPFTVSGDFFLCT